MEKQLAVRITVIIRCYDFWSGATLSGRIEVGHPQRYCLADLLDCTPGMAFQEHPPIVAHRDTETRVLVLMSRASRTGNNVQISADTTRRIIHIRLDVLEEPPEERIDFRHKDLLDWIAANRERLLVAAMTILTGFFRAGRPQQQLIPYGSFEGWSSVVRAAVVWVGMPDPCLTRTNLSEYSDVGLDLFHQFMDAWEDYAGESRELVVVDFLRAIYAIGTEDPRLAAMRATTEALVGASAVKPPTPRQLGTRLRKYRRRVVKGRYFDVDPLRGGKGKIWRLFRVP